MNKSLVLTALLILISLFSYGQASKDTLYLKNGSMVSGRITGITKTEYRIQTTDGYLFTFSADEVERYIPAAKPSSGSVTERKANGFSFIMESGIPIGSSDEGFPIHFTITPSVDYSFNLFHSITAGTGLEYWEKLMLPLFAEYRVCTSDNNVAPFLYLRFGGLINLEKEINDMYYKVDHRGGWTFATGIGLIWPLGSIESFVKIGYRYAYTRDITTYSDSYPPYNIMDEKLNFNCLEMKWGFKF